MSMYLIFMMSIMFICSSMSYWTMWLGLEMVNFFLIPWLMEEKNVYKNSKIFFYFVVQVIATGCFLLGAMNYKSMFFFWLLLTGMIIKLGSFPLHMWVLSVVENMNWKKFSFFMTMSKMGPISVMTFINPMLSMVKLLWGGLMVPLMGLKTSSIRKMLAYSSIAHMSWIMICIVLCKSLLLFFLASYWSIFIISCLMFNSHSSSSVKDLFYPSSMYLELFLILCLMGFPPFLGFFPKLFTLKAMCFEGMMTESVVVGILSIIPFFFYLKMLIMMCMTFSYKNLSFISLKLYKKNFFLKILLFVLGMEIFCCCL
uniref:NADH dehydrogenase subunit 2 n=1 Tax=Colpocephalum eucarenum TaxID=2965266 RepID=UPI0026E14647|nr:NADH dehydrogenase subunit 2 [Colpocephalum eucarenum]WIM51511.1 NADH dehydrogenase subunit 2 [Colpocephalum eucarenum]